MTIRRFSLGTILILGAVALFLCLGSDAKIKDPSEYTLRVNILNTTQNVSGGPAGYHGWGYANVSEGSSLEGVFYKFDGCPYYVHPTSHMARWKKERKRLALVVNGEGKQQVECDLNVRMDGVVYSISPLGLLMSHEKK
jgi:hypothetical protein